MSDAIKHIADDIFSFRKTAHCCTCIVCATQSNCWSTVDFLSPDPCPQQPRALITRFRESYSSVSLSPESKRLKKWRSDELNSGNALIQHLTEKVRFLCFLVLPGNAETGGTWGGVIKRLLITCFIGNWYAPWFFFKISALYKSFTYLTFLPKISTCVHVCQSYSKPKVGRFWRQCMYL